MASLMAAADLFIGAGGTSSWERCCIGLPALVIATADNQIAQAEALARAGAQLYLGPAQSVTGERLARTLEAILGLSGCTRASGRTGTGLGRRARR